MQKESLNLPTATMAYRRLRRARRDRPTGHNQSMERDWQHPLGPLGDCRLGINPVYNS